MPTDELFQNESFSRLELFKTELFKTMIPSEAVKTYV
jgi:hypothetical protein